MQATTLLFVNYQQYIFQVRLRLELRLTLRLELRFTLELKLELTYNHEN